MKYRNVTDGADALRTMVKNMPPKEYKAISPSSLGGCMRVHYWKLKGIESTTPPNYGALVNFQIGFLWEQLIAKAFKEQGNLVKWFEDGVDKPFYDEKTGLGGLPDMIIKKEGKQVILDSKTVNSAYFRYAKIKGMAKWVDDNMNYVYQQVAYVYLAREAGYDVDSAILTFASKDDGYIGLEFQVEVTDELLDKVLSRAKRLQEYIKNDELPPCECEGWKIGYCGYGNPNTREPNSKKKEVNTECCELRFLNNEEK